MTGMDDLIVWLRAALDDDERAARAAPGPKWAGSIERGGEPGRWTGKVADLASLPPEPPLLDWQAGDEVLRAAPNNGAIDHAIRWDPARVLAEVDAKRRILDAWETWARGRRESWADYSDWTEGKAVGEAPRRTTSDNAGKGLEIAIKILALPLAGREGYRDEWRP